MQELIILVLFLVAAAYVARLLYRSFSTKGGSCAKGCGSACSTIDFKKIQKELEQKQLAK
ncbi:FeoB-associated Cys-rich membrane protein [Pontibacter qinzhouensis]|uniref:FeoB-associated Cys-rich membrane protein n=1 Tax=Pontibacter qinzhouensis TaxID=2603253 RepID=A0A5C8KD33_9BACT|nr:FeoB-associated Cys-rich membrane protein [Pontibacter qinzhouensis]TXK51331.1 FeoB-associated Cys-rich membrane protein [Pontibacter qinzhouensis]